MSQHLPRDGHLRAIGMIAVLWSGIEASMEIAISGLYGIDLNKGLVFTANIGFQSRVAMLRILAKGGGITDAELAARCLSLLRRTEEDYPRRNDAVHGLWTGTDDPTKAKRMAIRAKGSQLRCVSEEKTVAELSADAEMLGDLLDDWRLFNDALGLFPSPIPTAEQ